MIYHGDAYQYILQTPDILLEIFRKKEEILKDSIELVKKHKIDEIFLSGSGSSYNATLAAATFAKKKLGIRVTPVFPVELSEEITVFPKNSLVIGISQQGTSTAVIQALDKVRETGIPTISMTGEYDTEIVSHADANIYVECGYEDAGSTTKGYTATVLTLYLFLLGVAKNSEGDLKLKEEEITVYEERIQKVILNLPKLLPICEKWAEKEAKKLRTCTDLIILTESNQKSLLLEEVLKISETSRFPVRGYEACEFIHGMYNAVTEQTEFLYLFSQSGSDSKEMQHLYEYYKGKNKQYAVNTQKETDDGLYAEFLQDSDFSTLEYTIPFQMLFVKASRERGIDLNIPKDPQFHHYMGSKIGQ